MQHTLIIQEQLSLCTKLCLSHVGEIDETSQEAPGENFHVDNDGNLVFEPIKIFINTETANKLLELCKKFLYLTHNKNFLSGAINARTLTIAEIHNVFYPIGRSFVNKSSKYFNLLKSTESKIQNKDATKYYQVESENNENIIKFVENVWLYHAEGFTFTEVKLALFQKFQKSLEIFKNLPFTKHDSYLPAITLAFENMYKNCYLKEPAEKTVDPELTKLFSAKALKMNWMPINCFLGSCSMPFVISRLGSHIKFEHQKSPIIKISIGMPGYAKLNATFSEGASNIKCAAIFLVENVISDFGSGEFKDCIPVLLLVKQIGIPEPKHSERDGAKSLIDSGRSYIVWLTGLALGDLPVKYTLELDSTEEYKKPAIPFKLYPIQEPQDVDNVLKNANALELTSVYLEKIIKDSKASLPIKVSVFCEKDLSY